MDQPKIEWMLRLMRLMDSNTNYTIDELAEKLKMSYRTIYRYIDTFRWDLTPVMRFDVNFPTVDHSEVASDTDSFTGLFLTCYCKALSNAFDDKMDFHNKKNRVSISLENKYPVVIKHRELASSQSL